MRNEKWLNSDLRGLSAASLLAMTALRLELIADRLIFQPLNLSAASFRILALLEKKKESAPSEIISLLGGSKSNITQRLRHLTRLNLVRTTKATAADRRRLRVVLTPSGRRLLKSAWKSIERNSLYIEKYFKPSELAGFFRFLSKLNRELDGCLGRTDSGKIASSGPSRRQTPF